MADTGLDPRADQPVVGPRDISEAPPHVQATMLAYAAFNARNLDAAVPPLDESRTCMTRQDVTAKLTRLVEAFPDATISGLRAYDLGNRQVGLHFVLSGTNTGPLAADLPATGRTVQVEMRHVVAFDEAGRVIAAYNLSDLDSIRRQLALDHG